MRTRRIDAAAAWPCMLLALLCASQAEAQAREIALWTPVSTAGNAVIELSGMPAAECDAVARTLRIVGPGSPPAPSAQTVSPCVHFVVPVSALAPGEYCLEYDDVGGPIEASGSLCMAVTGVEAELTGATLSVGERTAPSDYQPDDRSCEPCQGAATADRACTRERGSWSTRVVLGAVAPELASTHLFALRVAHGPEPVDTALGANPTFIALSSELVRALLIPVPDAGEQSCVELHARPLAGGSATALARTCVAAAGAIATRPTVFSSALIDCDLRYRTRWCRDNRDDCADADPAVVPACAAYADECSAASADAGAPDPRAGTGAGAAGNAGADSGTGAGRGGTSGAAGKPSGSAGTSHGSGSTGGTGADGSDASSTGCDCRTVESDGRWRTAWPLALALALLASRHRRAR